MRSRTAGVMTTLMRNGRDRRSGKPAKGHAIVERVLLVGTRSADHIRASGHSGCIATGQASTRKQAGYMAAPERFAKRQIRLAPRAPSIHGPSRTPTVQRSSRDTADLCGRRGWFTSQRPSDGRTGNPLTWRGFSLDGSRASRRVGNRTRR